MSVERMEFKTEMKQLMDIIVNSLYSNKDIFLRELISNANDAIDKLRFEAITRPDLMAGDAEPRIRLSIDNAAKTLTISDNGIGMGRETIIDDLGTIAKSGTRAFLDRLKDSDVAERPELIGQFGVGFYSAFMVTDKVTVLSRPAGSDKAVRWESDGQGSFTVEEAHKAERGTDVVLHLKESETAYLESYRLKQIVSTFSNFVEHPILMEVETPAVKEGEAPTREDQTLNQRKAIWLRRKSEITQEEYDEFYKHLTRDFENPAKVVHYIAEGAMEFRALLFLPARRPFSFFDPDDKRGVQLYIHRVFIQDNYEHLLPRYLRFVRGVVEASDLPLNVSRELLQENQGLAKIKKNLTDKVLDALTEMRRDEPEKYATFFSQFGSMIREGVATDFARREQLADLLLYDSVRSGEGKTLSLAEYVEQMPEDQKALYYLIGERRESLARSPYLEAFLAKGYDVLLMTDPIDEWVVQGMREYKEKPIKAADEGDLTLDEEEGKGEEKQAREAAFGGVLERLKANLDEVKDVRLSGRLKESAAVLVRDEGDPGRHMEAMMKQLQPGGLGIESKRILELNPDHPAVAVMLARFEADPEDPKVIDFARLFYDQAQLAEGRMPADPAGFARRVNDLITQVGK